SRQRLQRAPRQSDRRDGDARPVPGVARLYAGGRVMEAETLTKMAAAAMTTAAKFALPEIELFVLHEAELLDQRRFREWMALLADDGPYWVPAVPNQKSPFNQASLFYDDRDLMSTRVARLEHPKIHVQTPPSRTVHQVGRVMAGPAADNGDIVVSSTVV